MGNLLEAAAVPEKARRGGGNAKDGGGHHEHAATRRHRRWDGAEGQAARAPAAPEGLEAGCGVDEARGDPRRSSGDGLGRRKRGDGGGSSRRRGGSREVGDGILASWGIL